MHVSGLLALLLSSTLSATPSAERSTAATELLLEVVELRAGDPTSFGFVVPIHGEVEAFVDRGDDPRRCEVQASRARDGLVVELRCDGGPDRALRVKATRALVPGKRTRIAEITHPGGTRRQVFVTLQ